MERQCVSNQGKCCIFKNLETGCWDINYQNKKIRNKNTPTTKPNQRNKQLEITLLYFSSWEIIKVYGHLSDKYN